MDGRRLAIIDLPEPGRAYQQYVVATGTGHLESTLHILLPPHVGEVAVVARVSLGKLGARIHHRRLYGNLPRKKVGHLSERVGAVHFEIVHHGGLCNVCRRHYYAFEALGTCLNGHG